MAEPWIKMRVTLHEHPKVVRIAYASEAYGRTHAVRIASVVGLLHRTWSMADGITVDGVLPGYTREALDALIGVPGWTQSLEAVGWASVTPDGIALCEFTKHNGATAKRRTQEADRQRAVRKASPKPYAPDADAERTPSSSSSISPSSSLSDSEGEPERDPTPKSTRRAKHAGCTLEEHLAELEFSTLRSDIVEAARAWSGYRRTTKNPRLSPWGPAQWRPALRDAIRDPDAFTAGVQLSIRQKYQGLIVKDTRAAPERLTAREASDRRHTEAWDQLNAHLDAQPLTPCSTNTQPARLSAGSATSATRPTPPPVHPPAVNGSGASTRR